VKHRPVKQNSFFKVKEGKVEKIKKNCPRCGEGVVLAEHKDRFYCGNCKYTEWKKK